MRVVNGRRRNDWRARAHPSWWAFALHRVSGLALALFLPVHLWALSRSLSGAAQLDSFLRWTDQPLFKFAEWGLVILLALHLFGGVRVMLIEQASWRGLRKSLVGWSAGGAIFVGALFAASLLGAF